MLSKSSSPLLIGITASAALAVVLFAGNAFPQEPYHIHINRIDREVTERQLLLLPKTVTYTVNWELYDRENSPVSTRELTGYVAYCWQGDESFSQSDSMPAGRGSSVRFAGKAAGRSYFFKVRGYREGALIESGVASIITGRNSMKMAQSWLFFLPHGRFPLFVVGKVDVYNNSTPLGKLAFEIIWFAFLAGLVILFGCAKRYLKLIKIFPFKDYPFSLGLTFRFDASFDKRITSKFKFILEAWKELIMSSNLIEEGDDVDLEEVRKRCAKEWNHHGVPAIRTLEEIIRFDPADVDANTKKQKIVSNLDLYFSELKKRHRIVEWNETGIFDSKIADSPTMRIVTAGMKNHKYNGYKWLESSVEVDRAIENRASAERELLQRKTMVDWLWNLGAISPLVGLFGTVVGITEAFGKIRGVSRDITHFELINKLSGGINEALWTTIFGLISGIILMLAYYYFKNKLDWIYSKWEEIYTSISEGL